MRTTVAQDLQRLFTAYREGRLGEAEFRTRKKALLDWSRCRLSLTTPRSLRFTDRQEPHGRS